MSKIIFCEICEDGGVYVKLNCGHSFVSPEGKSVVIGEDVDCHLCESKPIFYYKNGNLYCRKFIAGLTRGHDNLVCSGVLCLAAKRIALALGGVWGGKRTALGGVWRGKE